MRIFLTVLYGLFAFAVAGQGVKVGDLLGAPDGSQGRVFWISPDCTHGWMVALEATDLSASFPPIIQFGVTTLPEALQDTAGYGNTALLVKALSGREEFASLAADLKNGWYIPALGQLRTLLSVAYRLPVPWTADIYLSSSHFDADVYWKAMRWGELMTQGNTVTYFPVRTFDLEEYDTTLSFRWNTGALTPEITENPAVATTYEVTATTPVGCYAKAKQTVFVASSVPATIDETICRGEVYRQYGIEATESGEYRGTLRNADGCEQEILVRLTVLEPIEIYLSESICEGEVYRGSNFTVWDAGEYRQVWQRQNGCDSTVILQLTVKPVYDTLFRDTVCAGSAYRKHGFDLVSVAMGQQVDPRHLTNRFGCDSVIRLALQVNPVSSTVLTENICEGESYSFGGASLTRPGSYYHTLSNQWGCDSVLELSLTVHPVYDTLFRDTVCAGSAYHGHGFDLTSVVVGQQVEPLHLRSRFGCDSVIRLALQVNPVSRTELSPEFICGGESYPFFGALLTQSGVYYHTLTNQWGCDSVLELSLTVNPVHDILFRDTVCAGSVYRKHGFDLVSVAMGQRVDPQHLSNRFGCDSVIRLALQVNPVSSTVLTENICDGESYSFGGASLTRPGTYYHTLTNQWGCDSVLELSLTVNPVHDTLFRDTVCAGSSYHGYGFDLESVALGQQVEPLHLRSRFGCDSVIRLALQVNPVSRTELLPEFICEGESYSFFGESLTQSGTYSHILSNQWGCDSILVLDLSVGAISRDTIRAVICAGERYQAHGFDEAEAGLYERVYADVHGCDSFVYLDLKVGDYFGGSLQVDLTDCALHEYDFEADWENQAVIGGTQYVWDFGNGESRETETPSVRYAYADTGTYRLRLEVITPVDCRRERTGSVWVPYYVAELPVHIRPEYLDLAHPEIRLWTDSVAGMRYTWDFGDGSIGYGSSVEHTYVFQKHEAYEVILESLNEEDCPAQKRFTLHAYATINPPNTITPNGDGVNDWFMRGYRVRIFNRNGVVVFQGEDGWDGQRDGQPVPEDTYFYEVYYLAPEGEKSKTGYVMVVR